MVVNPFFLHGSTQEQNLMQDLVNEQIRMHGMDVYYIPRTIIRDATIMREVTSSEFRSYFIIEAYLNNYDGYGGQGDIMSKFGIQVKDEVTLTISRERYENYIAPFMNSRMIYLMNSQQDDGELITIQRPREGDLIYFPLGRRIFEIKYVEHEQPFYQLGKGYTYDLQCELFEYEDEVLDTTIDEVDTTIANKGDISTLRLVAMSNRAEVEVNIATGYIRELTILNEGRNYTSSPKVIIDPPAVGTDPNVVALISKPDSNLITSALSQLVVFDSGTGYTQEPNVKIQGDGTGAVVKAGINTSSFGVINFEITNPGKGYPEDVPIIVYNEDNEIVAEGIALTDGDSIAAAVVKDPGEGLQSTAYAVVSEPANGGLGNYLYNEIIVGKSSGMRARVRSWNAVTFELEVTNLDPEGGKVNFEAGEVIQGETSGARYSYRDFEDKDTKDGYSQNQEVQEVADVIVDTEEYNQFLNPNEDFFDPDNPFDD